MQRKDWKITRFDATGDWDEDSPSEALTPRERLSQTWPLIRAMWKMLYGNDPERRLPRHDWPVVKYEIHD